MSCVETKSEALFKKAILLFCTTIGLDKRNSVKPFDSGQWRKLLLKIASCPNPFEFLLTASEIELTSYLPGETAVRIAALRKNRRLQEEISILAVEHNIFVLTQADPLFPKGIGLKLPFLYCRGDASLLSLIPEKTVAIVGARDADEKMLTLAALLGSECAKKGICVLSGGANGVDTSAQYSALNSKGTSIFVLPCGLLSRKAQIIYESLGKNFLLLSTADLNKAFSAKQAHLRNNIIYDMVNAAFVIGAKAGQGGTWSGASAALREGKTPIYVFNGYGEGNEMLINSGANEINIETDLELNLG